MARYTTAYSAFVSRLDEVETLRKLALQKERVDPIGLRKGTNALCRGAVVLLSGHLEAYVKDIGEVALLSMTTKGVLRTNISSRLYYYVSQDLITELKDTADPEKLADKMFAFIGSDLTYWSKSGAFPQPIQAERFSKGFASPAFPKIKQYFNRFGYDKYAQDLSDRLRAEYHPTVNMINHLVDTRNKIAHGDPAASKTPAEVGEMVSLTRVFCASTDAVFAEWWKSSFCSIR